MINQHDLNIYVNGSCDGCIYGAVLRNNSVELQKQWCIDKSILVYSSFLKNCFFELILALFPKAFACLPVYFLSFINIAWPSKFFYHWADMAYCLGRQFRERNVLIILTNTMFSPTLCIRMILMHNVAWQKKINNGDS